MKRKLSVFALAAMACCGGFGAAASIARASEMEARRYVVTAAPGQDVSSLKMELKSSLLSRALEAGEDLRYHAGFRLTASPEAVEELRKSYGDKVSVEEDYPVYLADAMLAVPLADERLRDRQERPWGVNALKAEAAFARTRGQGVIVCVADTGTDWNHPDLRGNLLGGENLVEGARRDRWDDDNGHGTHVAGTIAALDNGQGVLGVAPEAKIFTAKALSAGGLGSVSSLAEAVRSCVAHGAQVINMSLATPNYPALLHKAVQDAVKAGVIVVAAAGNWRSQVAYPAKFPEAVAVSAVTPKLKLLPVSNFGPEIAFAAPGGDVLSALPGGKYGMMSGTSMASPHVAGVAALMVSARAQALAGDDIGLPFNQQGRGLINALKTVTG